MPSLSGSVRMLCSRVSPASHKQKGSFIPEELSGKTNEPFRSDKNDARGLLNYTFLRVIAAHAGHREGTLAEVRRNTGHMERFKFFKDGQDKKCWVTDASDGDGLQHCNMWDNV